MRSRGREGVTFAASFGVGFHVVSWTRAARHSAAGPASAASALYRHYFRSLSGAGLKRHTKPVQDYDVAPLQPTTQPTSRHVAAHPVSLRGGAAQSGGSCTAEAHESTRCVVRRPTRASPTHPCRLPGAVARRLQRQTADWQWSRRAPFHSKKRAQSVMVSYPVSASHTPLRSSATPPPPHAGRPV